MVDPLWTISTLSRDVNESEHIAGGKMRRDAATRMDSLEKSKETNATNYESAIAAVGSRVESAISVSEDYTSRRSDCR